MTEVKLPLGLAGTSGIAKDSFTGCTNQEFKEIEFVLDNAGKPFEGDNKDITFKTALANIYNMFAASGNDTFASAITLDDSLLSSKWCLPVVANTSNSVTYNKANNNTPATQSINFNGIK